MGNKSILKDKLIESIASVLPILVIVAFLCFLAVPVSSGGMLSFFVGAVLLIVGTALFQLGADTAMAPIGKLMGARLTKTRKLWLILLLAFVLGIAITISEPDLQVLATNVPHIDTMVLILTVAIGVGLFLLVSFLRILLGVPLRWLLLVFYVGVFVLAYLSDPDYLSVAFDSGGVTTGPMTVPFIMALGLGVSAIRSDRDATADSFGLVALCSIGPILAVLILGFVYPGEPGTIAVAITESYGSTVELGQGYLAALPHYLWETFIALAPIAVFFFLFQAFALKLERRALLRILIGLLYTYVGLVLFLTGVNVGFSPLGSELGAQLSGGWTKWLLIPLGVLMGWFIIKAEPAVHVLNKQVEEVSSGAVSEKAMGLSLSIAIALSVGLAMLRVLTGIPILYFLVPGYAVALILSFFVPPMFTAIAFDSGGVASGPMTATFLLPLATGASAALGGNVLTDAFGLVALVAMMPLITIQIMGMIYVIRTKKQPEPESVLDENDEITVIELWEVA